MAVNTATDAVEKYKDDPIELVSDFLFCLDASDRGAWIRNLLEELKDRYCVECGNDQERVIKWTGRRCQCWNDE